MMPKCHECGGQMPNDHAAYCSTGQIAALQDENARLREALDRVAATAKHHRETANEEALRQENDPDMPSMIRDKLSGKITVRRLVAESLEGVLASLSEGDQNG